MLIEFQVGNFLSFKEIVTFSMIASEIDSQDEELDENNVFSVNKELNLLKYRLSIFLSKKSIFHVNINNY